MLKQKSGAKVKFELYISPLVLLNRRPWDFVGTGVSFLESLNGMSRGWMKLSILVAVNVEKSVK